MSEPRPRSRPSPPPATAPPGSDHARRPLGGVGRAWRVATVVGAPVRLDASVIVLVVVAVVVFRARLDLGLGGGWPTLVGATIAALGLLGSLVLHEIGHALVAADRGLGVRSITVSVLAGATDTARSATRPRDDLAVAVVGPAVNVVLAAAFGLTAAWLVTVRPVGHVAGLLAWANLGLAGYTLLPGEPLDGGRVLRAVMWLVVRDRARASRWAARAGQVVALAVMTFGAWQIATERGLGGLWAIGLGALLHRAAADAHHRVSQPAPRPITDGAPRLVVVPAALGHGTPTGWLHRVRRRVAVPVAVATLAGATLAVPLPYFVESPGRTLELKGQIRLGAAAGGDLPVAANPIDGEYLLTTVHVAPGTLYELGRTLVDDRAVIQPAQQRLDPDETAPDYFNRQRQVFDATADVAAAVALAAAGFPVEFGELGAGGAEVLEVLPGSAAEGTLRPGDVITAVNGAPLRTATDLRDAVEALPVDRALVLELRRDGQARSVAVTPTDLAGEGRVLGIRFEPLPPRLVLPFAVAVDGGSVGGPSAGLMTALAVYDRVDDGDLARGRRIAGTGTIDRAGEVGRVGGIAFKVAGALRDGAELFLVPASQIAAARAAAAGTRLHVLPVTTFTDALEALDPPAPPRGTR